MVHLLRHFFGKLINQKSLQGNPMPFGIGVSQAKIVNP